MSIEYLGWSLWWHSYRPHFFAAWPDIGNLFGFNRQWAAEYVTCCKYQHWRYLVSARWSSAALGRNIVRNRLNEIFPNRWIGRGGPIQWPPRSPDLTIMDFFMWSWIKNRVYAERIIDIDHLRNRILMAFDYLKDHQQLLRNNHRSLEERCRTCLVEHGAHVENHLW